MIHIEEVGEVAVMVGEVMEEVVGDGVEAEIILEIIEAILVEEKKEENPEVGEEEMKVMGEIIIKTEEEDIIAGIQEEVREVKEAGVGDRFL